MDNLELRWITLGILVFFSLQLMAGVSAECSQYTSCGDCITEDSTCAWCNDQDVLLAFARNSSTTLPAQLCGTPEELVALNCREIINPMTTVQSERAPDSVANPLSLLSSTVSLRPGTRASVEVTISPPQFQSADMYLLMDLSLTMLQNLNSLRSLAQDLVDRMNVLSSDFRIGFGSFIDKPVPPYADKFSREFPCAVDAQLLGLDRDSCEAVYSYRHVLNFTNDASALERVLNASKLSASPDNPESVLDGILQSALCEDELGWRPRGQSQRIIVVFTDGDYHYALDGKIGGILAQPAKTCRLDPTTHEYTTSDLYDYPSAGLISDILNEKLITPIFAVPSQVRTVYDGLAASIRSASVGTLSANPDGVINLIEDQYRILIGTVLPILDLPTEFGNDLNITVLPADGCTPGSLRDNTSDVCMDIIFPRTVRYLVEVSASPRACLLPQPITAQVQFIRHGTLDIEINLQCDCDCSPPVVDSPICNSRGKLECSTCVCNDNQIGGAVCECPVGVASQPTTGCRDPQDAEDRVCNGQGSCQCGQCQCLPIAEGSPLLFQGEYCQFDPQNCPLGRDRFGNFTPCAGNGVCNSNSGCECYEGFTGGVCECTTNTSSCVRPGDEGSDVVEETVCSGEGQCICGQCVCNNYSASFGAYCEECLPCRSSCPRVSPCVLCRVLQGAECPLDCQDRLQINDTTDMITTADMKVCSLREGSCEVRYFLGTNVQGNEDGIQIFLDSAQRSLDTLGEGSSSCNPSIIIWPIFVGIILGTIFVGILVIVLWRCFTYLGEYLEYQQWSKSIKNDTERSGENPLFLDPTAQYSNPRYVSRRT